MYYFKTKEEADAREKEFYAFIKRTKEQISNYADTCILAGINPPSRRAEIDLGDGLIYSQRDDECVLTVTYADLPDSFYIPDWQNLDIILEKNGHDFPSASQLHLIEGQYRKVEETKISPWGLKLEKTELTMVRSPYDTFNSPLTLCFCVDHAGADITIRFKELMDYELKDILSNYNSNTFYYNNRNNSYVQIINLCNFPREFQKEYYPMAAPGRLNVYMHYCDLYPFIKELSKFIIENTETFHHFCLQNSKALGTDIRIYTAQEADMKSDGLIREPVMYYDWQPDESFGNKVTMEFLEEFLKRMKTYHYGLKYERKNDHFNVSILDFFYMKIYATA